MRRGCAARSGTPAAPEGRRRGRRRRRRRGVKAPALAEPGLAAVRKHLDENRVPDCPADARSPHPAAKVVGDRGDADTGDPHGAKAGAVTRTALAGSRTGGVACCPFGSRCVDGPEHSAARQKCWAERTADVSRDEQKPRPEGGRGKRMDLEWRQAQTAFLRRARKPTPSNPDRRSGRPAGSGTADGGCGVDTSAVKPIFWKST